jgi:DNA invertase Pin-like site-specific DNA recombinase
MATTTVPADSGTQLGYARVSTRHQSLDQQIDVLTAVGVDPKRVYSDKLSGTSTREQRPSLVALRDYARPGDAIVVVGIDRLGRNAAEVMMTIRELGERDIVLRSLREGIDTSNATGRMVAGVLASLAELELELGRERRAAALKHVGHEGSTSVDRRRSTLRKRHWRSGCTQVANQSPPSLARSALAGQLCIASWLRRPAPAICPLNARNLPPTVTD